MTTAPMPTGYLSVNDRYRFSLGLTANKDGSFVLISTDGEVLAEGLNLNFETSGYGQILGITQDHFAFRRRAMRALNSVCIYWRVKCRRTRDKLRMALA